MDRRDAQSVQFVRIVLVPSKPVLLGVVPVKVSMGEGFWEMVSVGLGEVGEVAPSGEAGVFYEVGGGLAARLGGEEDELEGESIRD